MHQVWDRPVFLALSLSLGAVVDPRVGSGSAVDGDMDHFCRRDEGGEAKTYYLSAHVACEGMLKSLR